MNEEEAKKKTCPINLLTMTFISVSCDISDKREEAKSVGYCQASDCMMWRRSRSGSIGQGISWREIISDTDGYCGLGGRL